MAKLSKELFMAKIEKGLKEKGFDVEKRQLYKTNQTYTGLVITGKESSGQRLSPVINVDALHTDYVKNGWIISDVIEFLLKAVKKGPEENPDIIKRLNDFEYVKQHLVVELYDSSRNISFLKKYVHRQIEDLALVPKIILDERNDDLTVCPVLHKYMNRCHITEKELIDIAIQNSCRLRPADILILEPGCYAITNRQECYGAAAIFYPGILDELYQVIGKFYILPISIHQCVVKSFNKEISVLSLKDLLHEMRGSMIKKKEELTDSIYLYDGMFKMIR